jgi:pimeloyl-ACP methyl ester carboxylesterase
MADPSTSSDFLHDDYDEFGFLETYARGAGLRWNGAPAVAREEVRLASGAKLSYIRWGAGDPELVLLHGAGQNAHTWDTFALAVDRPAIAIDLPGHGRSDWRPDRDYLPVTNAAAVIEAMAQVAPTARAVIGMSLGGLTAIGLATLRPDLVRRLVLVDITPARPPVPAAGSGSRPMPVQLMSGPRSYPSWEAMVDAAHATMPHRARHEVIPGVRHNARRLDDGSWGWRYDHLFGDADPRAQIETLWADVSWLAIPSMLVRGALSPVVTDEAAAEFLRRVPEGRVETVADAGHAVQSDQPIWLAELIEEFLR